MRIVVEERQPTQPATPTLEGIAESLQSLGHEVLRWTHFEGRGGPLPECDLAFLWNGLHPVYWEAIFFLWRRGQAKLVFLELGWLPQGTTFQLDGGGINALANWAGSLDPKPTGEPVSARPGDLLVALQSDSDMQLLWKSLSPWFQAANPFLKHLAEHSQLPMRIRPHPTAGCHPSTIKFVEECDRMTWDAAPTLEESMESAAAVAVINSTCGLRALEIGLPVLCYGSAIYRYPGAVYCMSDNGAETARVTGDLKVHRLHAAVPRDAQLCGTCELDKGAQRAVIEHILQHQYTLDDLPGCLEPFLGQTP